MLKDGDVLRDSRMVQFCETHSVIARFNSAVVQMQVILVREHDDCKVNSSIHSNCFNQYLKFYNKVVILTPQSGNVSAATLRLAKATKTKDAKNFIFEVFMQRLSKGC